MNHRNTEFDEDYATFIKKTDAMKEHIGLVIEENFSDIWETPQGYQFLIKFEKVSKMQLIVY